MSAYAGPIFRAEDGTLWMWNSFRSELQRHYPAESSLGDRPGHTAEDGRLRDQANPNQQADQ